ncbi:hypothetical protein BGZ63DRAFT_438453 [Mariannaea sp. PMI_226]|nr:hypothetical protein BGZ63DRAFT_438453 [Mariannaea sp. PMI_226]
MKANVISSGNLETNDAFVGFWHRMSPYLTFTDLAVLDELHPDPATHCDVFWANSPISIRCNISLLVV